MSCIIPIVIATCCCVCLVLGYVRGSTIVHGQSPPLILQQLSHYLTIDKQIQLIQIKMSIEFNKRVYEMCYLNDKCARINNMMPNTSKNSSMY